MRLGFYHLSTAKTCLFLQERANTCLHKLAYTHTHTRAHVLPSSGTHAISHSARSLRQQRQPNRSLSGQLGELERHAESA